MSKSGYCSELANSDNLLRLSQGGVTALIWQDGRKRLIYLFIEKRKAINDLNYLVRPKRRLVSCDDASDAESN